MLKLKVSGHVSATASRKRSATSLSEQMCGLGAVFTSLRGLPAVSEYSRMFGL